MQLKKYKKEFTHSYALGPFPTFELLKAAPSMALEVHAHPDFNELEKLKSLCKQENVPFFAEEKSLARISEKELCWAAGVFKKTAGKLCCTLPHVVLHNPSDMGNLGTILRTLLGFGILDLAVIEPAADLYNPKVVRASMGAMFRMRTQLFESFEEYMEEFGENRELFPFMLDGKQTLSIEDCPKSPLYSLIFGNEARGLPKDFAELGRSVFIPQSPMVDSLNLAVSVAVGSFIFTSRNPIKN